MNVPEIEFDWDEANIGHMARHSVLRLVTVFFRKRRSKSSSMTQ
jgi:hypothetical protein